MNKLSGPVNANGIITVVPKNHQSRREKHGLVIPNKRRATQSGGFLGTTRRAGAIFPASCVVSRLCRMTTPHAFRLAGEKNSPSSGNPIRVNRP